MFPQPLNRPLRTIGLNKIDGDAEKDHDDDNSGVRLLSQYARNNAGKEQNDYQWIDEQNQEFLDESAAAHRSGIVGAELRQPFLRLLTGKSDEGLFRGLFVLLGFDENGTDPPLPRGSYIPDQDQFLL